MLFLSSNHPLTEVEAECQARPSLLKVPLRVQHILHLSDLDLLLYSGM